MEKQNLLRFVNKYHLQGLVQTVKWSTESGKITTSFVSNDKSVLGMVSMDNHDGIDGELGIYDTSKLIKMLNVLGNDINYDVVKVGDKVISLKLSDSSLSVNYMLSDLSVIPKTPDLKQLPDFDVTIELDTNFIDKFIKAKGALADEDTFTFVSKNGVSEIIIGYSNVNTNRISLKVEPQELSGDIKPISFSAKFLKEILASNRDADSAKLRISTSGLSHVKFESDGFVSEYFLIEINL